MRQRAECLARQLTPTNRTKNNTWKLFMSITLFTIPATSLGYLSLKIRLSAVSTSAAATAATDPKEKDKKKKKISSKCAIFKLHK